MEEESEVGEERWWEVEEIEEVKRLFAEETLESREKKLESTEFDNACDIARAYFKHSKRGTRMTSERGRGRVTIDPHT